MKVETAKIRNLFGQFLRFQRYMYKGFFFKIREQNEFCSQLIDLKIALASIHLIKFSSWSWSIAGWHWLTPQREKEILKTNKKSWLVF